MPRHIVTLDRDRLAVDAEPRHLQAELNAPGHIDAHKRYSRHDLPLSEVVIRGDGPNACPGEFQGCAAALDQEPGNFDYDLLAA